MISLEEIQKLITQHETELKKAKETITNESAVVERETKAIEDLKAVLAKGKEISAQKGEATKKLKALSAKVVAKDEQIAGLEERLKAVIEERDEAKKNGDTVAKDVQDVLVARGSEIAVLTNKLQKLTSDNTSKAAAMEKLQADIESYRKKLAASESTKTDAENQARAREGDIIKLQGELDAIKKAGDGKKAAELEVQVINLKREHERVIVAKDKEIAAIKVDLASIIKDSETALNKATVTAQKELDKLAKAKDREIKKLQKQVEALASVEEEPEEEP